MPRQGLDPNFEYPLAYRLAQFLLGAGDQLGQFGQGQLQQSTSATNVLEAQGREELQRDVLGERRREADLKAKERADAAARASAQRNTTNRFWKDLAARSGVTLPEVDDPSSLDPSAFKFGLEQLLPKKPEADEYTSGDLGIFSKRTGEVKVPKPDKPEPPEYISGDLGIFSKRTGEIKTPKPEKPAKPFFEGKTATELQIIAEDPMASPEDRQRAERALAKIEARDLTKARETGAIAVQGAADRATGPQPLSAEERKGLAEGERTVQLAQRSLATLEQNPTWVGGPLGLRGRAREWQASLGTAPPGFAEFQADVQEIYGTYARRIAGAALTPTEKSTYLAYLPNITTDSDQQFRAKLQSFPERVHVIDAALERARLGTAAPAVPSPGQASPRKPDFRYNPASGRLEPVP